MLPRISTSLIAILLVSHRLYAAGDPAAEQYAEFMSAGLYSEAAVVAKQRLSELERDAPAERRADLLFDLALAQKAGGEAVPAAENLVAAMDIRAQLGGNLDPSLAAPLEVLGDLYFEASAYEEAIRSYLKAVHITNVNDGPHNLEQAGALKKASEAELMLGDTGPAITLANRAYLLFKRAFDASDEDHIEALLWRGSILGEAGKRREERDDYESAMAIVREAHGGDSPKMIEPLVRMAGSLRDEYFEALSLVDREESLPDATLLARAETQFERAVEIVDDAKPDWEASLDAVLGFADFLTLAGEHSRSRIYYRRAWRLLSADATRLPMRRMLMQRPNMILDRQPQFGDDFREVSPDVAGDRDGIGSVTINFVVGRNGSVQNAGILEVIPERDENIEAVALDAVNQSVYRPRFERGVAVASESMMRRFEFRRSGWD